MRSAAVVVAAVMACASCGGSGSSSNGSMGTTPTASNAPPASSAPPAQPTASAPTSPAPPPASSTPPNPPPAAGSPANPTTPSPASPQPPTYQLIEIPRLTTAGSVSAAGINSQGVVVGSYQTICTPDCGGLWRAWMYQESSGSLIELTFDPSEWGASAAGISDSGVIAGEEISLQDGQLAGYWTVAGGAVVLTGPSAGNDWAVAANDNGTLVGDFGASGTPGSLALMWSPPGYAETTLPGLECDFCPRLQIAVNGINSAGAAVGHSLYSVSNSSGGAPSSDLLAVEWQSSTVTSLGSLNDSGGSDAYGINSSGDIVGASRVSAAAGAPTHAYLYHKGVMIDLGTLAGDVNSSAVAINDSGQIVGSSDDGNTSRAFLYQDRRMYDLATLVDPGSPLLGSVTLKNAAGVSSNGWIVVNGSDSRDTGQNAGTTRAFLLIPAK